ncbi:C-C motif chemokine 20-like [Pleurodeles waltl]|uniref:C-C motif chemokine 20-like n=1 Tax=Pleurodeles waltl TaxID=8319 RepID=UPI003709C257
MKTLPATAFVSFLLFWLLLTRLIAEAYPTTYDCCYRYTRKPLPRYAVRRFTMQSADEVCDINAVIFHTRHRFRVCANPQEKWVKVLIETLSKKTSQGRRSYNNF